jgi:hypothetical protein
MVTLKHAVKFEQHVRTREMANRPAAGWPPDHSAERVEVRPGPYTDTAQNPPPSTEVFFCFSLAFTVGMVVRRSGSTWPVSCIGRQPRAGDRGDPLRRLRDGGLDGVRESGEAWEHVPEFRVFRPVAGTH